MMDWIGLCGFVCLNRRSSVKLLATVMKLKYSCSGIISCALRASPQDDAAFVIVHPDLALPFDLCIASHWPL